MRKAILSIILLLTTCFTGSAGSLNNWTNYNFQGVWEITSNDNDGDLGWLIKNIVGTTIANVKIVKLELALDVNGWGYITFYSNDNYGKFDIRGRIFIPGINEYKPDCLTLLCANDYSNLTYGLINFNVSAYNGDATDSDAFTISAPVGSASARAIRTSSIYVPGAVYEVIAPSMLLQYNSDGISVIDSENANVSVYDIDGVLVYQTQNYSGETITLSNGKYYIVKVNDNSIKISF